MSGVAVIGAGGIGVDVSEFLTHDTPLALDVGAWQREWGVSEDPVAVGALVAADPEPPRRRVYLLQRTASPVGTRLGMTTGWIHRAALRAKNVQQLSGVDYLRIDDDGLHIGGFEFDPGLWAVPPEPP